MTHFRSFVLLATSILLFGCAQPPSCEQSIADVQEQAQKHLSKALAPLGVQLGDVVAALKVVNVAPLAYKRETRRRTCGATLNVQFKPETFSNIDQFVRLFGVMQHPQVKEDIQTLQLTSALLRQQGIQAEDQLTLDYEFDVGLFEDRKGSYVATQSSRLAVVTPYVRAGGQANAFMAKQVRAHQQEMTTPKDLPLHVKKVEPCGEEALCVQTTGHTVRLNVTTLSDDQMRTLANAGIYGHTLCFRDVVAMDTAGDVTAEGFTTGNSCAMR